VVIRSGNFRRTYSRPNEKSVGKTEYVKDKGISPIKGRALEEGKPKIETETPKTTIRKVPKNKTVENPNQNPNEQEQKPLNKRPSKVNIDNYEKPKNTKPSRENSIDNVKPNKTKSSRERTIENIKVQKNQSSGSGKKIEKGGIKP
jgi:hypothetical protein